MIVELAVLPMLELLDEPDALEELEVEVVVTDATEEVRVEAPAPEVEDGVDVELKSPPLIVN